MMTLFKVNTYKIQHFKSQIKNRFFRANFYNIENKKYRDAVYLQGKFSLILGKF